MTVDSDGMRWEAAQEGAELLREGATSAAIAELETVLGVDADNPYALYFLGSAYFEDGDFDRALKAYVLALEAAPDYLGAMVGAAHSLRMMGRLAQALRMGQQVLARSPDDADGLYVLGLVHYARGEEEKALGYLERFLETGPEIEVAQEVRGLVTILRGQDQQEEAD
ncbi:MAG: tetratricopeptide repeat protein [Sandaracinaceae bacterium]